jgi:hypothetical protein
VEQLTIEEVTERLDVSSTTLKLLIRRGLVTAYRHARGRHYFDRCEIEQLATSPLLQLLKTKQRVFKWSAFVDQSTGRIDPRGDEAVVIVAASGKEAARRAVYPDKHYRPPLEVVLPTWNTDELKVALSEPGVPFWSAEFLRSAEGQLIYNKARVWQRLRLPAGPRMEAV